MAVVGSTAVLVPVAAAGSEAVVGWAAAARAMTAVVVVLEVAQETASSEATAATMAALTLSQMSPPVQKAVATQVTRQLVRQEVGASCAFVHHHHHHHHHHHLRHLHRDALVEAESEPATLALMAVESVATEQAVATEAATAIRLCCWQPAPNLPRATAEAQRQGNRATAKDRRRQKRSAVMQTVMQALQLRPHTHSMTHKKPAEYRSAPRRP